MGSLMSLRSCKTDPGDMVAISIALEGDGRQDKNLHHAIGPSGGRRAPVAFNCQMVTEDAMQLIRMGTLGVMETVGRRGWIPRFSAACLSWSKLDLFSDYASWCNYRTVLTPPTRFPTSTSCDVSPRRCVGCPR